MGNLINAFQELRKDIIRNDYEAAWLCHISSGITLIKLLKSEWESVKKNATKQELTDLIQFLRQRIIERESKIVNEWSPAKI